MKWRPSAATKSQHVDSCYLELTSQQLYQSVKVDPTRSESMDHEQLWLLLSFFCLQIFLYTQVTRRKVHLMYKVLRMLILEQLFMLVSYCFVHVWILVQYLLLKKVIILFLQLIEL